MSRPESGRIPVNTRPCHSVEDCQSSTTFHNPLSFRAQAVRATFFGLPAFSRTAGRSRVVYRVATTGHQCAHIQRRAHRSSTAPHGTLASMRTAVPIERRHTDQGSDLLAVQACPVPADTRAVSATLAVPLRVRCAEGHPSHAIQDCAVSSDRRSGVQVV